jgi:hypothetical protein
MTFAICEFVALFGYSSTYAVGNDMGVSVKTSLGVAIGGLLASEVPDNQCLIATGRKEHVWAVIEELVFYA